MGPSGLIATVNQQCLPLLQRFALGSELGRTPPAPVEATDSRFLILNSSFCAAEGNIIPIESPV
jgi:hypothetical protein